MDFNNIRMLRKVLMPQNNYGYHRYTWHSVQPLNNGTEIPICRVNIHGVGFQSKYKSSAYSRMKITISCRDQGTTQEYQLYKTANKWRIGCQSFITGSVNGVANSLDVVTYSSNGIFVPGNDSFDSEYIEFKIINIPQHTVIRNIVNITIEFDDCNHTIWFFNSEINQWEKQPIVAVTGCSDVEADDLKDLIFTNYSDAPYGDRYRFMWTEKKGYYNYGVGGHMIYESKDRMRINNGDLELYHPNIGWEGHGFTNLIIGCGTIEAINLTLRKRGVTHRNDWERMRDWHGDPKRDIDDILNLINSVTARKIEVTILLFSALHNVGDYANDLAYPVYSLNDGSPSGYVTKQDWLDIKEEWGNISDDIFAYAMEKEIKVIDWFSISDWYHMSKEVDGISCDGGHYNVNGWLKIADYTDVIRRI